MAQAYRSGPGRARQLCPGSSDVDFLRDLYGVIDLDAEVANRALDLRVSEQKLYGPEIPGAPVDQRGLGSAQRVRAELQGIETNACDPLADEASILPRRKPAVGSTPAAEQKLSGMTACHPQILVDGLPSLLGQLEPDGPARLLLAHGRPVDGVAVGSHVIDPDRYDITAAQLAVDSEIEEG